ncbi:MAG: hypothetical protein ACPGTU_10510 [Myxococcota bacterium]
MTTLLLALTLSASAQVPVSATMDRTGAVSVEHMGGPFGIGLGLGAPSGVAGKLWISDWSAFQFSAGGDIGEFGDLVAVADYVLQFRPFESGSTDVSVPLHVGGGINVGGNIHSGGDAYDGGVWRIGPRGVIGLSVLIKTLPIDIYVETAPTIYIFEDPGWSFDGQIGIRHYL